MQRTAGTRGIMAKTGQTGSYLFFLKNICKFINQQENNNKQKRKIYTHTQKDDDKK